jgi:hypothetical protein
MAAIANRLHQLVLPFAPLEVWSLAAPELPLTRWDATVHEIEGYLLSVYENAESRGKR